MKRLRTKGLLAVAALAAAVAGCGSSGGSVANGSGTVNGTVAGMTLTPQSAASVTETRSNGSEVARMALVSVANVCSLASRDIELKNTQGLELQIAASSALMPGAISIWNGSGTPPATSAAAFYSALDSSCKNVSLHAATSGTVSLSQVSSSGLVGTFDLTMDTGDHITGSFDAPTCAVPDGGSSASDGGGPVCQ